jgi:3-deoxy-manno-octulosonate cytidylyltransferase (CMP-KDO synthetase)
MKKSGNRATGREKMNIHGVIPVRMNAHRFPGKPLHPIAGKPMVQHVYERSKKYPFFDNLIVATPDLEIITFCDHENIPAIATSHTHNRAMDRVGEAARLLEVPDDDIVVCIQGDEPLITAELLGELLVPMFDPSSINCAILTMRLIDEEMWRNSDTVKVVHDTQNNVMFTSRAPIPHMERFTPNIALRIGGVFAFRKWMLDWFISEGESPLEIIESCDSNRICGRGRDQLCVIVPARPYFSVDRIEDVALVEKAMEHE